MVARDDTKMVFGLINREVAAKGLSVCCGEDFLEAQRRLPRRKGGLTRHFAPDTRVFPAGEAFWLALEPKEGGPFRGFIAVCREDVGNAGFAAHIVDIWRDNYRDSLGQALAPCEVQAGVFHQICGDVAYLGDLWVHPAQRGAGNARRLMALAQVIAFERWPLDWIYCWIRQADFIKGNAARWGWVLGQGNALRFQNMPAEFPGGLALAANPRWAVEQMAADMN